MLQPRLLILATVFFFITACMGPEGPARPQGELGTKGPQGELGPTGSQGPAGPRGAIGQQGAPGSTGPQGVAGAEGPVGSPGIQGLPGPRGADGEPGLTGEKGEKGDRGERGEEGDLGETGEKGDRGDRGESSALKSAVYTSISPRVVSKDWASYLEVQVVATGRGRTIVFADGTITVADHLNDFPIEIALGSGSASSPTANLPDKSLTNSFDASQGESIPFTVFNTYEVPGPGAYTYSLLARCPSGGEQLVRPGTISAIYVPSAN